MKKALQVMLAILVLSGCVNTDAFISGNAGLSVEEAFAESNAEKICLDRIEAFYSGEEWMAKLMELTSDADDYILMSTFLGSSSAALEPFYRLLCTKAESGVDVYMIIDGSSSYDMTESRNYLTPLYFLKDHGVHLIEYNPFILSHIIAPQTLLRREHRKMFVFDGEYSALGGMNLNYISLGGEGASQRDSMYLFDSPDLARALVDIFVDAWNGNSVEKIRKDDFRCSEGHSGKISAYLFNQDEKNTLLAQMYAALFASAEKEILFFPYMPLMDDNMESALLEAKDRGVDIHLAAAMDRDYVVSSISYVLPSLYDLCTNLYLVRAGDGMLNLHEKLLVVDGRYTVIGSANFNYRSMGLSNEICLVVDDVEFAEQCRKHFFSRLKEGSVLITEDEAQRVKGEEGSFFYYLYAFYGG